ncbi:hypothetical protein [Flavitalea sp.]|nr:hypothetical protein [Flavitalea sp.]
MARKVKIPSEQLKRFAREEQRRKQDVRAKRMYYLMLLPIRPSMALVTDINMETKECHIFTQNYNF